MPEQEKGPSDVFKEVLKQKKELDLDKLDWDSVCYSLRYCFGFEAPKPMFEQISDFRREAMSNLLITSQQMMISTFFGIFVGVMTNIAAHFLIQQDPLGSLILAFMGTIAVVFIFLYFRPQIKSVENRIRSKEEDFKRKAWPVLDLIGKGFTYQEILNECSKRKKL